MPATALASATVVLTAMIKTETIRELALFYPQRGAFPMVITAAHLPAIVALIAGILILLMPRLLNFVVAIYLIFIGLVGLGVFKALHF